MPTWAGVAYVCFIIDAFSRTIVGWRDASNMRTTMVLDALEMARWSRGNTLPGLTCHSDAGSQFTSIRYGERLAEIGALPSIGSVGDSFDSALAETVNGYYKAELIYGPARTGPWKTVEDVELAILSWVYWHNTTRLHSYLKDVPPAEFEATFYDAQRTSPPWSQSNSSSLRQNQGDSVPTMADKLCRCLRCLAGGPRVWSPIRARRSTVAHPTSELCGRTPPANPRPPAGRRKKSRRGYAWKAHRQS